MNKHLKPLHCHSSRSKKLHACNVTSLLSAWQTNERASLYAKTLLTCETCCRRMCPRSFMQSVSPKQMGGETWATKKHESGMFINSLCPPCFSLPVYLDYVPSRKFLHERNCLLHHCYCSAHTSTESLHHSLISILASVPLPGLIIICWLERIYTHRRTQLSLLTLSWLLFIVHSLTQTLTREDNRTGRKDRQTCLPAYLFIQSSLVHSLSHLSVCPQFYCFQSQDLLLVS